MKIEHNPESGCAGCPFSCDEMGAFCQAERRNLDHEHLYGDPPAPAPEWCPIRGGDVIVTKGPDHG